MYLLLGKIILSVLVSTPNLLLTYKILSRPHIHSIFNTSLACFFAILGVFGPIFFYYTLNITNNMMNGNQGGHEGISSCSHFLEVRQLLSESLKIISSNIMFRFFYIVYANRGLVQNGKINTRIFNICFVVLTLALSISSYFSVRFSQAYGIDYPKNTIGGRICLSLRINWDRHEHQRTKDIFMKTQLLIGGLTLTFGLQYLYMIKKVHSIVPKICLSNKSHACFGGRYRRNILTFDELSFYLYFIIFHFIMRILFNFLLFWIQDSVHFLSTLVIPVSCIASTSSSSLLSSWSGAGITIPSSGQALNQEMLNSGPT